MREGSPRILRVVDFGQVTPIRSQTLWHAAAAGVDRGAPPTLSFVRTVAPYVSIGFHRSVGELNREVCGANGWQVIRRMVGGGPVFMDPNQLCFQICVPLQVLPGSRVEATRFLLAPALAAFRRAGLDVRLDRDPEVVVGDRKVCGHAAAQLGSAVVLVGNLIESFDHSAAASILATPDRVEAEETLRLMRRYVAFDRTGPRVDAGSFMAAAREAYASALGLRAADGELSAGELEELDRLDRRFADPEWTKGVVRPESPLWRAKIRSGVWRYFLGRREARLGVSVVDATMSAARVEGFGRDGELVELLDGAPLGEAPSLARAAGHVEASDFLEELVCAGRLT